uniref:ZP domain-containing protein n=1 Tax=Panagrolaimus davidi TaxID=227884 RepID=A0A914Q0D4_9BILA
MKNYWVEVEVHPHNAIISDLDPVFNVSCNTNSMSYQPKIDYFLELYPLPETTNPTTTNNQATFESPKTNGKTYILDAFMASIDDVLKYRNHFKMTNCIVESEGTAAIEIIDSNGCSTNQKQITNVVYTDEWASVNMTDVNPYLKVLKLKCKFSICDENEICRENCDRNWYDSIEKGGKKFAKFFGFGDSSKTAAEINDPLLSNGKSTIVHISVPLKPDDPLPPEINFFVEKCQKIDLYFFTFEHCCSTFGTFWLYVGIASVWLILFGSVLLNLFYCFRCFKGKNGSDSDSGDYWVYEDVRQVKKTIGKKKF